MLKLEGLNPCSGLVDRGGRLVTEPTDWWIEVEGWLLNPCLGLMNRCGGLVTEPMFRING